MARFAPITTAFVAVFAALLAACNADVTEGCVAGPCGSDAGTENGSGSGTGGSTNCFVAASEAAVCASMQPAKTGDLPCEVYKVMEKLNGDTPAPDVVNSGGCHDCHRSPPRNGAPFALLTYEDLQSQYYDTPLRKYQRMIEVIQLADDPATKDTAEGAPHMPFGAEAPPLSCDDAQTLSYWLAGCAPPDAEGTLEKSCCKAKTCADVGATGGPAWNGCGSYLDCDDGQKNGEETDVDCGGDTETCLTRCGEGKACANAGDCDTVPAPSGTGTVKLTCTGAPRTCQLP